MVLKSVSKPKRKPAKSSYDPKKVILVICMPIIGLMIWGSYNHNLSHIYANAHSKLTSSYLNSTPAFVNMTSTLPFPSKNIESKIGVSPSNILSQIKKTISKKPRVATITIPFGPAQTDSSFATYPSWYQDFADYGSSKLDSKDWEINQGPPDNSNNEAEYYTNSSNNLFIKNGALTLKATKQAEPMGYSYASSRIDTKDKKSFLYGRIDIEAEIPNGVGAWPAIWLLPANNKYESLSPASDYERYVNGGEIDLVEEVGFQPNTEYGIVHSVSDLGNPNGVGQFSTVNVPDGNDSYNLYSLLWTPTTITFEVNNVAFFTYTKTTGANYTTWPFDQPFYLILNLALGGSWGGEDTSQFPGNGIDNSILPAMMNIKSIFYYPYVGS